MGQTLDEAGLSVSNRIPTASKDDNNLIPLPKSERRAGRCERGWEVDALSHPTILYIVEPKEEADE